MRRIVSGVLRRRVCLPNWTIAISFHSPRKLVQAKRKRGGWDAAKGKEIHGPYTPLRGLLYYGRHGSRDLVLYPLIGHTRRKEAITFTHDKLLRHCVLNNDNVVNVPVRVEVWCASGFRNKGVDAGRGESSGPVRWYHIRRTGRGRKT